MALHMKMIAPPSSELVQFLREQFIGKKVEIIASSEPKFIGRRGVVTKINDNAWFTFDGFYYFTYQHNTFKIID